MRLSNGALVALLSVSVSLPHVAPAMAQSGAVGAPTVPGIYGLTELGTGEPVAPAAPAAAPETQAEETVPAAKPARAKPVEARGAAISSNPSAFPRFKSGIAALRAKRVAEALATVDRLPENSVERRTLAWAVALYGAGAPATHIARVAAQQPNWPGQTTLRTNLEYAIVRANPSGGALRVAFGAQPPQTVTGRLALARAELAAGNRKAAQKLVRTVWRESDFGQGTEARILRDHGRLLTLDDHRVRVERLVGKRRFTDAARLAPKAGYKRLASAAIASARKRKDRIGKLDRVPGKLRSEPMYGLALAQSRRLAGRYTDAATALIDAKRPRAKPLQDRAAKEQYRLATELLHEGETRLAYRVAAREFGGTDARRAGQAFQAGWIALRFRNDADTARKHFDRLAKIAEKPISMSRAAYWQGRAAAAAGRKGDAQTYYKRAAKWPTTFYGQLAAERLGRRKLDVARTRASAGDRKRFGGYELVRGLELLEKAGARRYARPLYATLAKRLDDPGEVALLAVRHERRGDYRQALVVGKLAAARGMVAPSLSHPIGAIAGSVELSKRDLALAYGVARQESAFQRDARSSADALGLMQLLPGTARQVSRKVGLRYTRARLTRDPAYNVRLGTTYLRDNRRRLGGSLPLALVAYNAGPSRARNWSKEFGNPRTMSVDKAIDWAEMIPFDETRNYVQRVMSNHQIYRARIMGASLNLGSLLTSGED